jgi:hypothetical protein
MSDQIKQGLIIGSAIIVAAIIAVSISIYFSPFQTCVRAFMNQDTRDGAQRHCAVIMRAGN